MIPFKDDNKTARFPYVTIALIVANVAVFILQLLSASEGASFTSQFAVIPYRFTGHLPALFKDSNGAEFTVNPFLTFLSYAFLHGSLAHLLFNMLFLWIFGNNIEDVLGRVKFIVFYLLCGFAGAAMHVLMHSQSTVPLVGASGAIAGVLGAYLVLFPFANIHTLFLFFIFIRVIKVPAIFFIGFWFFMQLMNVVGNGGGGDAKGVAWFTHIGGFVMGIALIMLINPKKEKRKLRVLH